MHSDSHFFFYNIDWFLFNAKFLLTDISYFSCKDTVRKKKEERGDFEIKAYLWLS